MKKFAKIRLIIESSILGLILLFFATLGVMYLYSDLVIFSYRNTSGFGVPDGSDFSVDDYPVNTPWFGNPLMIPSYEEGPVYAYFCGSGGEKNIDVYNAVNVPMYTWEEYLYFRYDRRYTLDYTVEKDSKSITVHFTGTAEDNGSIVPIDQSFIYDIENASPANLPTLTNEDNMTDEYKEFLNYLRNYETVPMPAWFAEKRGA